MNNADKLQQIQKILLNKRGKYGLFISKYKLDIFDKSPLLHHVSCSGFLKPKDAHGAIFDFKSWPFKSNQFDIIILDNVFLDSISKSDINYIFRCANSVLADDGLIVFLCDENNDNHKLYVNDIIKKAKNNNLTYSNIWFFDNLCNKNILNKLMLKIIPKYYSRNYIITCTKNSYFLTPLKDFSKEKFVNNRYTHANANFLKNKYEK